MAKTKHSLGTETKFEVEAEGRDDWHVQHECGTFKDASTWRHEWQTGQEEKGVPIDTLRIVKKTTSREVVG